MSPEASKIFLWCNGLHDYPVVDAGTRCHADGWHNDLQGEALAWCGRAQPLTYEGLLDAGAPEQVLLNLLLVERDHAMVMKCSGYPSRAPRSLYRLVNDRNTQVLERFPRGELAEALRAALLPEYPAVPPGHLCPPEQPTPS